MVLFDPHRYAYPSRRSVVYARRAMACTSVPLGAQVGLDVMKAGGNAVDAAVAMAAAMPLLEPTGNGIGGDCFALVWVEREKKLYGLNASGVSPAALSAAQPGDFFQQLQLSSHKMKCGSIIAFATFHITDLVYSDFCRTGFFIFRGKIPGTRSSYYHHHDIGTTGSLYGIGKSGTGRIPHGTTFGIKHTGVFRNFLPDCITNLKKELLKNIPFCDFVLWNFDHRNFGLLFSKFLFYWAKWSV